MFIELHEVIFIIYKLYSKIESKGIRVRKMITQIV